MAEEKPRSEMLGEIGAKYKASLVKAMAQVHGDRPSDAKPLSHEEELRLWMMPTSPAAVEAFKRGATMEEAHDANRMWAEGMKAVQQQMLDSGATPQQVHEAGYSDDKIMQVTRAEAYKRGKANSRNDPEIEAEWHSKMAERAARFRAKQPIIEDVTPGQEPPDAFE